MKRKFFRAWMLTITILLLLGVAVAYDLYLARRKTQAVEYDRLIVQARVIDENMTRQLVSTIQSLERIADNIGYWRSGSSYRPAAGPMLQMLANATPGVRTLLIVDAKGIARASSRPELIGRDVSTREYFQTVLRSHDMNTVYLSPPYTTVLNVYAMNVSHMIKGAHGEFDGIVVATLDPNYFKTLIASVQYAPDMWVAIAHGDGIQFMMVPDRPGQSGKNLAQPGSFFTRHKLSNRPENLMTGTVYATGEKRVMALRTIQPADAHLDKPFVVAVGRDVHAVFAAWVRDVMIYGGFYLAVAMITVITLRFYQHSVERADRLASESAKALEKSEAQYRFLAENTRDVVWQMDLLSSRFTFVSPSVSDLLGYTPEEMMMLPAEATFSTGSRNQFKDSFGKAYREFVVGRRDSRQELQLMEQVRKDGTTVWTEVSMTYIFAENQPTGIVGISRDVTARRKSEELLRKQAALLQLAPAAIMMCDLENRITYWNRGAEELYGWTNEEASGKVSHDLLRTEFPEPITQIEAAIFQESSWQGELIHRKRGGEPVIVASRWALQQGADGRPAGFLEINIDITERKHAENALRESEQKFRKFLDLAPIPIGLVSKEGTIDYLNDRFIKTFGYTRSDVSTLESWWRRAYPDEAYRREVIDTWNRVVRTAMQTGADIEPLEYNITCKDGTMRIAEISGIIIDNNLLATFVDLTDRRRAEEGIRQALREKETLLQEIHHRVKNNMQVISSLLYLQAQKADDSKVREIFVESQQRVRSMALVHEKMYQTRSLSEIDFKMFVEQMVEELSSSYSLGRRRISTIVNIDSLLLSLELAIPCALIINELITNAYKHAFPGDRDGEVRISFSERDGSCQLTVTDNGIGMPPDFDPAARKTLGFQIVSVLVTQLNGDLRIASDNGAAVSIAFSRTRTTAHAKS